MSLCLAHGNEDDGDAINWAYQVTIMDGLNYSTQENAQIYDLPFSHTLRPIEKNPWGIRLKFPVTIGLYNIDSTEGAVDVNVLAVVPGVEFQYPLRDNWMLMPLFSFGFGKDTAGGDLRYIYSLGIKHHVFFGWKELDFTYGNSFRNNGFFTDGGGPNDNFTSFDTGLDMRFPLGFSFFNKEALFSIYAVNYYFFDRVRIVDSEENKFEVNVQWEIGITFGTIPFWKIWFFEITRIGLGYRFGDGLDAIRLVFGMPF